MMKRWFPIRPRILLFRYPVSPPVAPKAARCRPQARTGSAPLIKASSSRPRQRNAQRGGELQNILVPFTHAFTQCTGDLFDQFVSQARVVFTQAFKISTFYLEEQTIGRRGNGGAAC